MKEVTVVIGAGSIGQAIARRARAYDQPGHYLHAVGPR